MPRSSQPTEFRFLAPLEAARPTSHHFNRLEFAAQAQPTGAVIAQDTVLGPGAAEVFGGSAGDGGAPIDADAGFATLMSGLPPLPSGDFIY